jgi:DNA-binding XRE family transcriptional regulator
LSPLDEMDSNAGQAPRRNRAPSQVIRYRLADNVRRLRLARGYTQRDLADLCQFTKSYISNVEQGTVNISLANLEAFAAGLVCREWELLR